MKLHHSLAGVGLAVALLGAGVPAGAGEGHDHGTTAGAAVGPALPRFAAVSEAFELVGVLDGKQITLYLDRFADNEPVPDALIELDIAGAQFKAAKQAGGAYLVTLNEAPGPGVLPITATVTAGTAVDLLAGELDLPEKAHAGGPAHRHAWKAYAGWAAGALAAVAALLTLGRRVLVARQARSGGAA